uniref:Uncharacterized protein n=1 Tax=Anguilla anguilla TaxID=7936 RepID=A0A0E9VN20_ANGAN
MSSLCFSRVFCLSSSAFCFMCPTLICSSKLWIQVSSLRRSFKTFSVILKL